MDKLSKTALAALERMYGKPLEDRGEIERRFKNAIANIDIERMDMLLSFYGDEKLNYGYDDIAVYRYRPPYDDKIALYFGDNIESADKWEAEICLDSAVYIPQGWCNRKRILIRGDWAAYSLSGADGEEEMTSFLDDIVSGEYWSVSR